ncbi:MAG: helix-turn-helix domain-containing protein [Pseudomonadota bacterium]
MTDDTRALFLDAAEALFAERGFYGTSISAIADKLGLTKQALLHHFGRKEKLYGEVLKRISARFGALGKPRDDAPQNPADDLVDAMLRIHHAAMDAPAQTRLLMRELLDNQRRVDTAGHWYLKTFLDNLQAMVRALPGWERSAPSQQFALVYQLLGAVNYFAVSRGTLTGIYGEARYRDARRAYPGQLERMIRAAVAEPA